MVLLYPTRSARTAVDRLQQPGMARLGCPPGHPPGPRRDILGRPGVFKALHRVFCNTLLGQTDRAGSRALAPIGV